MTYLLMSLFACANDPKPKMMGPEAACYTLTDELPEQCLTMAKAAFARSDAETAVFGFSIACRNGLMAACAASTKLPEIGVEPYDAALGTFGACFKQRRKPACRAYLTLLEGDPKATPKLIERARSIVASPFTAPSSTPASDSAEGDE